MEKYFTPKDWSSLCSFDEPLALIKYASSGLRGKDLKDLSKRAGEEFAYNVSKLPPPNGEEYVHVIALGSYEAYGPNRKGDSFPEKVCREYHDTFRKYARWYREHIHHDPSRSYGIVKLSAYNEKMRRIDLVVALNATKEACDRNGGLIADEELQQLYLGRTIPVSMACKVSHDICTGCGNKAKNIREYCDERICIKYGGCKRNLGKLYEDGHILCVINPDPIFFDISYVRIPADRTAFSVGLLKSGFAHLSPDRITVETIYKTKEDIHNQIKIKTGTCDKLIQEKIRLLQTLVGLEKTVQINNPLLKSAFSDVNFSIDLYEQPYIFLKKLNSSNRLMPPAMFSTFKAIREGKPWIKNATFDASSAFQKLFSKINFAELMQQEEYITPIDPYLKTSEFDFWSLEPNDIQRRIMKGIEKCASAVLPFSMIDDVQLVRSYAIYQLDYLISTGVTPEKLQMLVLANKLWN